MGDCMVCTMPESGPIRLVRPSAVSITHKMLAPGPTLENFIHKDRRRNVGCVHHTACLTQIQFNIAKNSNKLNFENNSTLLVYGRKYDSLFCRWYPVSVEFFYFGFFIHNFFATDLWNPGQECEAPVQNQYLTTPLSDLKYSWSVLNLVDLPMYTNPAG